MSAAHITPAEATALSYAREDFARQPTGVNAAHLLTAAYVAWNESHLDERELATWVIFVASKLMAADAKAAQERVHADCEIARQTLAFAKPNKRRLPNLPDNADALARVAMSKPELIEGDE